MILDPKSGSRLAGVTWSLCPASPPGVGWENKRMPPRFLEAASVRPSVLRDFPPRGDHRAGKRVAEQVEHQECRRRGRADSDRLDVNGVHRDVVMVSAVARRRGRAEVALNACVVRELERTGGKAGACVVAGTCGERRRAERAVRNSPMPESTRGGASAWKTLTTKLLVPAGNPDHDNCGDVSVPPAPSWSRNTLESP